MDYRDALLRALARRTARHGEVLSKLSDPDVVQDHRKVTALSRELGQLRSFRDLHDAITADRKALADARELLASGDAEMKELAEAEIAEAEPRLESRWKQAEDLLVEDDVLGDHDVILEIRAGVGGDEAGLFAGDLLGLYQRFCALKGLKLEVMDENPGEMGGYKEVIAEVTGPGAYRLLSPEGGVHRVQRVPATETQGRIHTSTATVAVLPQAEEVDVKIDWDKDVREDKMRAGGPGGQKVNKTESAIRLTHLATGISVHMQDEKSQHKNRARARQILAARVFDHFQSQADAQRTAERRGMIGNADRSAKIRTYNFPQDRCTDHRVEFTVHNLDRVMDGDIDALHERLRQAQREEKLRALLKRLEQEGGESR
ncbi:MAG: Peptide chain release factor 1 [Planctomycetes bacterium]|nr:Peptide chain release factor 1 [Planctomycetota bacterium]